MVYVDKGVLEMKEEEHIQIAAMMAIAIEKVYP